PIQMASMSDHFTIVGNEMVIGKEWSQGRRERRDRRMRFDVVGRTRRVFPDHPHTTYALRHSSSTAAAVSLAAPPDNVLSEPGAQFRRGASQVPPGGRRASARGVLP